MAWRHRSLQTRRPTHGWIERLGAAPPTSKPSWPDPPGENGFSGLTQSPTAIEPTLATVSVSRVHTHGPRYPTESQVRISRSAGASFIPERWPAIA
jgi:hypothetical protein